MVDLEMAARFLGLLDNVSVFTFQTFADSDTTPAATRPCVLHGSLDEYAEQLTNLNDRGAGIFVMVNAGDGVPKAGAKTCRTTANVQRVRAVFVDLDGAPITPVLESALQPDWVVHSSPRRWHAYWKVGDCPLDRFASIQTALAARFNGDDKVTDLPRVMRIPGFLHRKADHALAEIIETLGLQLTGPEENATRGRGAGKGAFIESGSRNATLASLAGTMRRRGMSQEAIEAALLATNLQHARLRCPKMRCGASRAASRAMRRAPRMTCFRL